MDTAGGGTDTEPVRLRPSLRTYGRTLRTPWMLLAPLVLALNVGLALRRGDDASVLLGAGGALLVLALLLVAWLLVARIWTTDAAVHRRDLLGRTRVVPRSSIASVLWLPGFGQSGGVPTGLLVLLDAGRRPLLRLDGVWWGADRLDRLAGAVGAPVTRIDDALTPADLAWRNMYELAWRHRHPALFALAVTGGTLAVVAVALLIASALDWI